MWGRRSRKDRAVPMFCWSWGPTAYLQDHVGYREERYKWLPPASRPVPGGPQEPGSQSASVGSTWSPRRSRRVWGPPCMSINCTGTAPCPGRDWTTHAFPRWAVCHRVCTSLGRGVCEGRKELPVAVLLMFLLPPHALSPLSCLPNAAGSQVTVAGAGGGQGHLAQRLGAGSRELARAGVSTKGRARAGAEPAGWDRGGGRPLRAACSRLTPAALTRGRFASWVFRTPCSRKASLPRSSGSHLCHSLTPPASD